MMEKDGQLSLGESQENKNKPKHHLFVVEKDKGRRRILDIQGVRRGRRQIRGTKFSPSTYLSRSR